MELSAILSFVFGKVLDGLFKRVAAEPWLKELLKRLSRAATEWHENLPPTAELDLAALYGGHHEPVSPAQVRIREKLAARDLPTTADWFDLLNECVDARLADSDEVDQRDLDTFFRQDPAVREAQLRELAVSFSRRCQNTPELVGGEMLDRLEALESRVKTAAVGDTADALDRVVLDYLLATGWSESPTSALEQPAVAGGMQFVVRGPGADVDTLIHCTDDPPNSTCIEELAERGKQLSVEAIRLVTSSYRLSTGMKRRALAAGVQACTLRELVFDLLGVARYAAFIDESVDEALPIADWFVEPMFSVYDSLDSDDEETSRNLGDKLVGELTAWQQGQGDEQRALLGDFGSGKTTVALRLVQGLLADFGRRTADRFPVLIRIRWKPDAASLEDLLAELQRVAPARLWEPRVFHALQHRGRLLVVVDGLDEIVTDGARPYFAVADVLAPFHGERTRTLVTSRSNFFRTMEGERRALGKPGKYLQGKIYRALRIEPFDLGRVEKYVRSRNTAEAPEILKVMAGTYDFPDLATRPVLLRMILDNWRELDQLRRSSPDRQIEVGDLYRAYIDAWLENAGREGKVVLDRSARIGVMVRIAKRMQLTSVDRIEAGEMAEELAAVVPSDKHRGKESQLEEEIRSQSFLVRGGGSYFYFGHRSFQEYFLALAAVEEVHDWSPHLISLHLSPEVIDFTSVHGLREEKVWEALERSRKGANDPIVNANLLSMLRDQEASFDGRDLSGLRARRADLHGANLAGAILRNAELSRCDFRNADLSRVDLTSARLDDLILGVRSVAKSVRFIPDSIEVVTGDRSNRAVRIDPVRAEDPSVLLRHADSVTGVAVGSRLVASCGFDGRVYVADYRRPGEVFEYGHNALVFDVAIDPEGRFVASSGVKGRLRIWSRERRQLVGEWTEHRGVLYSVDWSPAGDYLATGSFDGSVGLWRFRSGDAVGLEFVAEMTEHGKQVNGVRFSPDGRYLASASNNGTVRVYDVASREPIAVLAEQKDIEWAVAFHPDGEQLVTAGSDGQVRIWRWRTEELLREWLAHESEIWTLDVDVTGEHIASGSLDSSVAIWRFDDGSLVHRIELEETSHQLKADGALITGVKEISRLQQRVFLRLGAIDGETPA